MKGIIIIIIISIQYKCIIVFYLLDCCCASVRLPMRARVNKTITAGLVECFILAAQ